MHQQLNYIFDPWCGWCYGSHPLLEAAETVLPVKLLHSGLFSHQGKRKVSAQDAEMFLQYDQQIAQRSGQPFGEAYMEAMLSTELHWLDSTTSLRPLQALQLFAPAKSSEFLKRLQQLRYLDGKLTVTDQDMGALIATLGIDSDSFNRLLSDEAEAIDRALQAQEETVHYLMQQTQGLGVPQFILQQGESFKAINHGPFLGDPRRFAQKLAELTDR